MTIRAVALATATLSLAAGAASAQVRTTVRAQAVYESYSFDPGFNFEKVSEFSVPVGVDLSIGRRLDVTLSSGYVSLEVTPKADYELVSGMLGATSWPARTGASAGDADCATSLALDDDTPSRACRNDGSARTAAW